MNPNPVKPCFNFGIWINLCFLVGGINLAIAADGTKAIFRLYKSTDRGTSWFQVGQGLPSDTRINALNIAGEVAVAGTERGIFVSRDTGTNWHPSYQGVGTTARVLCFNGHGQQIFAGTQDHGVMVSDDKGTTWQMRNNGLRDLYVRSLLAAGTKLYAGTDSQGIFVSDNAGASWTNQRTGLPDSSQVFDLAAVDGDVFAGLYSKGIYRWNTEDKRWAKSGKVFPLELVVVGKTLVVGHNPGGIFVSEDRGETWLDGNIGLPVNAPTWSLAADNDRIYLGTTGKVGLAQDDIGLFASKDRGKSWTRSDAGLPPSGAAICFAVSEQFVLVGIYSRK